MIKIQLGLPFNASPFFIKPSLKFFNPETTTIVKLATSNLYRSPYFLLSAMSALLNSLTLKIWGKLPIRGNTLGPGGRLYRLKDFSASHHFRSKNTSRPMIILWIRKASVKRHSDRSMSVNVAKIVVFFFVCFFLSVGITLIFFVFVACLCSILKKKRNLKTR